MSFNTYKTVFGFVLTRLLPESLRRGSIKRIYNYWPIDQRVSTSGQPTAKQFKCIRSAGFDTVINLAPANAENALPDQGEICLRLE